MTSEELEQIVAEAGVDTGLMRMGAASCIASEGCAGVTLDDLQKIVAAALSRHPATAQANEDAEDWLRRTLGLGRHSIEITEKRILVESGNVVLNGPGYVSGTLEAMGLHPCDDPNCECRADSSQQKG